MSKERLSIVLAAALLLTPAAQAQTADAALRAAIESAERGLPAPALAADHPAQRWVEMAALRRNIDTLPAAQAQAFLARYRDEAVAGVFREAWLRALLKRQDWSGYRAAWSPTIRSTALRCAELDARARTGAADAQWTQDAQAMWRSSGKSLPGECDAVFTALAARGGLTDELRWERIELAAAQWEPVVMRAAARELPPEQRALATDYAAFVQSPNERALNWPKTARSRLVASHGLAKFAKADPLAAEARLPALATALGFSEQDRGRVLYQAALWTVASYLPDSARLLGLVPDAAYDDRLHEWRVREALARSDWKAALAALQKMGEKQRGDSRWQWFEARMRELTGDRASAQALFAAVAKKPDFHGFLAADRLDQPYALCPWMPDWTAAQKAAVAADPAMVRAMALYRAERSGWAQREWDDALSRFDDAQRRIAVEVAQDNGWFDRGVFGLGKAPGELQLYTLRFPIHHADAIEREARRNGLDPAWVAAEIRAESVFNPKARSPANARGLMQVLPETGAAVARRLGLAWGGAESLYDSNTNITLGTAYLREKEAMYGKPYVAIAAYNAGPTPTSRWLSQRPTMDPDLWIETISYKETREYVARILAFSVIYDWRMYGMATPVTHRMNGTTGAARRKFACPAP
ncbi:lytic transglycosylase domain-containing protein [Luteimonas marina]|uniref:Lytic transglycosylase domain-containing protein n=1 Tax=Luteimonas marina TaxID=488485 RepID=A0A5C5UA58_9GAMM|nr:lytic transglycosylase domain-containing protein [Luteimonas marina]TWT22432.1 lytic transglycosylase domain-containing protein [Luteimonas marina]